MIKMRRRIRRGPVVVGPVWVAALMVLWAVAMILPAALPH
jgi:hypothetical protein